MVNHIGIDQMKMNPRKTYKGYTFIELLVVIGIFLTFAVVVALVSIPNLKSVDMQMTVEDIRSLMLVYQQDAYSGKGGEDYGMAFSASKISYYSGDSLGTASSVYEIELPDLIRISSINISDSGSEIHFRSGEFKPVQNGSVTFTGSDSQMRIDFSREGLIEVVDL